MRVLLATALAAVFTVTPALPADLPEPPAAMEPEEFEKRWHFAVGAYAWAAGLNGDVGVGGLGPVNVDLSFDEILSDLDLALMAVAELRYGRVGLFTDLFYTRLSTSETVLQGFVDVDLTTNVFAGTMMGRLRLAERGGTSLDAMAGGRLWSVGGELDLRAATGQSLSRDTDETWVDPMVGVRGRLKGDSPLFLTGWGMIGGFGVGSDLGWDVLAAVGYEVTDRISLLAGYRAMGVDYEDDGFVFDTVFHGPVISGVLRF